MSCDPTLTPDVMNSQPVVPSDHKVNNLSCSLQRITRPFQQKTNTKPDLSQLKTHILAKGYKKVVSIYTLWIKK